MTAVDRTSRCIVGWSVVWQRSEGELQQILDAAPYALHYFSDAFNLYLSAVYAGQHHPMPDKSETYSVEATNAELRHYLARLARRSRCFSRSLVALRHAVRLFVYAWNRRQLHKHRFPRYPAHLLSFAI
jgi:IS1 family transposase